jgi:hypothetical protein
VGGAAAGAGWGQQTAGGGGEVADDEEATCDRGRQTNLGVNHDIFQLLSFKMMSAGPCHLNHADTCDMCSFRYDVKVA